MFHVKDVHLNSHLTPPVIIICNFSLLRFSTACVCWKKNGNPLQTILKLNFHFVKINGWFQFNLPILRPTLSLVLLFFLSFLFHLILDVFSPRYTYGCLSRCKRFCIFQIYPCKSIFHVFDAYFYLKLFEY